MTAEVHKEVVIILIKLQGLCFIDYLITLVAEREPVEYKLSLWNDIRRKSLDLAHSQILFELEIDSIMLVRV